MYSGASLPHSWSSLHAGQAAEWAISMGDESRINQTQTLFHHAGCQQLNTTAQVMLNQLLACPAQRTLDRHPSAPAVKRPAIRGQEFRSGANVASGPDNDPAAKLCVPAVPPSSILAGVDDGPQALALHGVKDAQQVLFLAEAKKITVVLIAIHLAHREARRDLVDRSTVFSDD